MPSLRLSFALAVVALLAACAGLSTSVNQNVGKDPDKPLPHKLMRRRSKVAEERVMRNS
jgi:hypothetical protein